MGVSETDTKASRRDPQLKQPPATSPTAKAASRWDSASPLGASGHGRAGVGGRDSPSRCKDSRCPQVTHGTRKGQFGAGGAELWTSPGLPCKRGRTGRRRAHST